ncbi:penicillin-binding protein 2 [Hyphomonas sp. FCG-A18]|uniref:peptidoglycan D,D-transpeptidase FtsI family protein n=1 Tax=Hyphomonas sp. FCG-A18 TaxID=3080019 RepID=UPI002B2AA70F|nr:penicillin-binding protein 2 [Hyphomonas sp. FCG-A18]
MTDRVGSEATMRGGGMRSRIVSMALLAVFCVIAVKGASVAISGPAETGGVSAAFEETTARADIVDRNGELLATSVTVYSLFADPRAMMDGGLIAQELASVLPDLDVDLITQRLSNKERAFVWIKRGLTPRQRQAVFELGLEGLGFREESRRAYPRGTLAGHVLGYAGADGQGLGGVEYAMDDRLTAGGKPLALTLDSNVQFSLEAELAAAVGQYEAEGAAGIVMRPQTGEVLGMASWPPIDPNRATEISLDAPERLDRASGAVFELGSVFKPITVAGAIDSGAIRPSDRFDVREPLVIRGRKISDDHPIAGRANITEIVQQSSNIGTIKVAWQMGARRQQELYASLGLFERAPIELAGSARPLVPTDFDELTSATTSYGHGIAVTPIAFAAAFSALANAGEYVEPTLLMTPKRKRNPKRVLSAPTAALVTQMMRQAVTIGTGKQAEVAGYRIAGKTGTAEKPIPGGYSEDENICSFAALFPADRPEYVVLIVLDTPKAGVDRGRTAAWNAAPTAGRVIERIAPILGVEPRFDAPVRSGPQVRSVSEPRRSDL